MILFAKDWGLYPTATVHYETRNRSWIRMASLYKSMGVKNHTFLLALVNPHLRYIDPHSTTLTQQEKEWVLAECKINPWYFFREVARIPGQGGEEAIHVNANRGNIALWWCFFNHITVMLIQPRQTGKSISTDELMVLLMDILCTGTKINLLTKDDKLRRENVKRLKEIFDTLPQYLNLRNPRTDINNTETIGVGLLKNEYNTHLPQASEKDALNVGRGFTSPINHIDEGPFCVNIGISLPAMLSSANAVRDRAHRSGSPYGTILTTTAGKRDTPEGAFMYEILQESMVWNEIVFDAEDWEDLRRLVQSNSPGKDFQINATFSHRQLGYTDEWLNQKMRESKSRGDAADRDYFNVWTFGTQAHPLAQTLLNQIRQSQDENPFMEVGRRPERYIIRWFLDEDQIESYMAENDVVIGVDTSEAVGNDDIALVFTNAKTLDVVACATINETNLLSFATWFAIQVLVRFKRTTAIIERRSTGGFLMDILMKMLPEHGEDPFKRMYNKVVQEHMENKERYNEIRQPLSRRDPELYERNKKAFGFSTSGSGSNARSELYGPVLQNAAKQSCDRVHDSVLIRQISSLTVKNGRIDHGNKGHDDHVVAWLLTHWFLSNGLNLAHYGITQVKTMIASTENKFISPQDMFIAMEQQNIRSRIQVIADQLSNEQDEYACMALEHQIRNLARGLTFEEGQINSVDTLINNIKENKKANRQQRQWNQNRNASNDQDYYHSMLQMSYRTGTF